MQDIKNKNKNLKILICIEDAYLILPTTVFLKLCTCCTSPLYGFLDDSVPLLSENRLALKKAFGSDTRGI